MSSIDRFTLAQEIVRRAGRFIVTHNVRSGIVKDDDARELVTEADLRTERMIREVVLTAFPEDGFLGEECGLVPDTTGYTWVVDPIDGTTNFTHHIPEFCVSIAVLYQGMPEIGVVYEPNRDMCYEAALGKGARCNGIRLETRRRPLSPQTLFGFSSRFIGSPPDHVIRVLEYSDEYRNMGSAALHLCYVARGWLDGAFADSTKLWDIAAAGLIVTEAGGSVMNFDSSSLFPLSLNMPDYNGAFLPVVATNGELATDMLRDLFNHGSPV
ncbi:MAG: inositol monophosphatase family protein [Gemmatimonadota bacterium]|nr:inositol monophosphatase family protein [Gemmatimonadota bacterium]